MGSYTFCYFVPFSKFIKVNLCFKYLFYFICIVFSLAFVDKEVHHWIAIEKNYTLLLTLTFEESCKTLFYVFTSERIHPVSESNRVKIETHVGTRPFRPVFVLSKGFSWEYKIIISSSIGHPLYNKRTYPKPGPASARSMNTYSPFTYIILSRTYVPTSRIISAAIWISQSGKFGRLPNARFITRLIYPNISRLLSNFCASI